MSTVEGFTLAPGIYVDVDAARRLCRGRRPNSRQDVREARYLLDRGEVSVKKAHWEKGELKDEPVIQVSIAGKVVLVDGWHRCRRAYQDGLRSLPAHRLDAAETKRVTVHTAVWARRLRARKAGKPT